jgi:succinate-semialdehyde dehydrogenase / glutarate-semialdehyde dehydrogenase
MSITTINPSTGVSDFQYDPISISQIDQVLDNSQKAFKLWKNTEISDRAKVIQNFSILLRENRDSLATLITTEMGCPISQAYSEVEKAAYISEIFASDSANMLANEKINYQDKEVYIRFDPLGTILHIAPWNYPLYLALRPTIPALMAGNTIIMKHSSNTPRISKMIENLMLQAGLGEGVFQSILATANQMNDIIEDERVDMVTLIGSEKAGCQVASQASSHVKKTIMELGGSDPFIVFQDADLKLAAKNAIYSRFRNAGQSCNAAKRFLVHEDILEKFTTLLLEELSREILGNPLDKQTTMGPLGTKGQLLEIERQVNDSISLGATLLAGGKRAGDLKGFFYLPTILGNVTKGMPVYDEEIFGPVAPIISFKTVEEATQIANDTRYGLGASIWTSDIELAKSLIPKIDTGNIYINEVVRGNPKLPFGGIKKSGYGREFGHYGIKEFVNIKTIVIS